MHIWLGNFRSEKEFKEYLNQKKYQEAWAVYDHEPPTGKAEEDTEPSPELRCDFCKELGLDTYDEDFIVMRYYRKPVDIKAISRDILVGQTELEPLLKKSKTSIFNSVIAYQDKGLTEKAASGSRTVKYIGNLAEGTGNLADAAAVHHLWIGENKLDKKNIIKQAGIDKDKLIKLNYYHTAKGGKVDELLILQVEEYNVAEKMILKADEMQLLTASSILELVVQSKVKIDGDSLADVWGMKYIGKFDSE